MGSGGDEVGEKGGGCIDGFVCLWMGCRGGCVWVGGDTWVR